MTARFYKDVSVREQNGRFAIELDGKPVKTPQRALLAAPTRALAEALAGEWQAQGAKIDPHSMRLTKLANTAVDRTQAMRDVVIDELLSYGESDHLCYRAAEPLELVERQRRLWDPVLDWAHERYGATLKVQSGIGHIAQPRETAALYRRALERLDDFVLTGLFAAVGILGSLVLALAMEQGRLAAAEAFRLSRLDEDYQAERWGRDLEAEQRAAQLLAELQAASSFMVLSRT